MLTAFSPAASVGRKTGVVSAGYQAQGYAAPQARMNLAQPKFGFIKFSFKETAIMFAFIGLEKSARLWNIVTFGKCGGLKKGEHFKFTIL